MEKEESRIRRGHGLYIAPVWGLVLILLTSVVDSSVSWKIPCTAAVTGSCHNLYAYSLLFFPFLFPLKPRCSNILLTNCNWEYRETKRTNLRIELDAEQRGSELPWFTFQSGVCRVVLFSLKARRRSKCWVERWKNGCSCSLKASWTSVRNRTEGKKRDRSPQCVW